MTDFHELEIITKNRDTGYLWYNVGICLLVLCVLSQKVRKYFHTLTQYQNPHPHRDAHPHLHTHSHPYTQTHTHTTTTPIHPDPDPHTQTPPHTPRPPPHTHTYAHAHKHAHKHPTRNHVTVLKSHLLTCNFVSFVARSVPTSSFSG